jgi:hypothetical protein
MPGFALRNRWGRGFLRRQVYRTCPDTSDDCEQRAREKKQFHSHEAIFTLDGVQIRGKINYRLVEPHDLGALDAKAGHHMRFQKNRPPD